MKAMYGVVLLYTEGMAICEDDWEDLWCAEMPEEFVTEGDGIEIDGLTPLEDLPIEQQTRIKNELDALPEEYLDVLRNYGGKEKFNAGNFSVYMLLLRQQVRCICVIYEEKNS